MIDACNKLKKMNRKTFRIEWNHPVMVVVDQLVFQSEAKIKDIFEEDRFALCLLLWQQDFFSLRIYPLFWHHFVDDIPVLLEYNVLVTVRDLEHVLEKWKCERR